MKRFIILILFIMTGCSTANKVYICGDHECKNKKERNDYFNNNISMEVYIIEKSKDKRKNLDLVQLNIPDDKKKVDKENDKKNLYIDKKKVFKPKNEKKPSKLKLKTQNPIIKKNEIVKREEKLLNSDKSFTYDKKTTTKVVHMCKSTKECDINIISKIVSDRGKEKSFPKINF